MPIAGCVSEITGVASNFSDPDLKENGEVKYILFRCIYIICVCIYVTPFIVPSIINIRYMQATFNAVPKWLKEVKEYASPDIKIMLLGNKCDLREQTDSENEGVDYLRAKVNICTCVA